MAEDVIKAKANGQFDWDLSDEKLDLDTAVDNIMQTVNLHLAE